MRKHTQAKLLILLASTSGGLAYAQQPQPYVADASTALLYHCDESSGSTVGLDDGGHSRHMTYGSGLTVGAAGASFFGNAIQPGAGLTNRGYWVDAGHGTGSFLYPQANSGFTIEGWIKLTNASYTNSPILFSVQPNGTANRDYELFLLPSNDASKPRALVFRDKTNYRVSTNALTWTANAWYHVAIVVQQNASNATYTIYRTPAGTGTATQVATATTNQISPSATDTGDRVFNIGNYYANSGNSYFPGALDEVRFSTVARAAADFNLTLGPNNYDRIRSESLAPNSESDHPLPLLASWNTDEYGFKYKGDTGASNGANDWGMSPAWQMGQLASGKHYLPWFALPLPTLNTSSPDWNTWVTYYQGPIQQAAAKKLPIVLLGTQWEQDLYNNTAYFNLPPATNPNVVLKDAAGNLTVQKKVSPFGPVSSWQSVGQSWGGSPMMKKLQEWYPNPPLVIFVSNNEAGKLDWYDAELDQHYTDDPSRTIGASDDYHRWVVGKGWIERYRALQTAWKGALDPAYPAWSQNCIFTAYKAFGPAYFSRWANWKNYALYVDPTVVPAAAWHIDPNPLMWDGGVPDNYLTAAYTTNTDYQVYSPQVEAMNFEFIRREAMQLNPKFWMELSCWNGGDFSPPNPADPVCAAKLCNFTPTYTPARYGGMVQFSMWINRPRVLRDFRDWTSKRTNFLPYFDELSNNVDKVYNDATLQRYWRNSTLVANTAHRHPYQSSVPTEYAGTERMYLLSTNLDPAPWSTTQSPGLTQELQVYALARLRGQAPHRQWLVYAYAPRATATTPVSVTITIPGYRAIDPVNATVGGSFYVVDEAATGGVTPMSLNARKLTATPALAMEKSRAAY